MTRQETNKTGDRLSLIAAGCVCGVLGLAAETLLLYWLSQQTRGLPRGTEIRPMGLIGTLWEAGLATLAFGLPMLARGIYLAVKTRLWKRVWWGLFGIGLCLFPIPFSYGVLDYMMSVRGLWLEQ